MKIAPLPLFLKFFIKGVWAEMLTLSARISQKTICKEQNGQISVQEHQINQVLCCPQLLKFKKENKERFCIIWCSGAEIPIFSYSDDLQALSNKNYIFHNFNAVDKKEIKTGKGNRLGADMATHTFCLCTWGDKWPG